MNRSTFLALVVLFSSIHSAHGAPLLRTVILSGQQAPGTPSGATFGSYLGYAPIINDVGQVAFLADLNAGSGGVTAGNDQGFWSEGSGTLQLVARQGFQAPGAPAGANIGIIFRTQERFDSSGQVAFAGALQTGSGGVTTNNDGAIWSDENGSLEIIAREGSQAPGLPAGANFAGGLLGEPLLLNDLGEAAFFASLQSGSGGVNNGNSSALWSQSGGALHLVARSGSHAPGTGAGTEFDSFSDGQFITMSFNQSSQLAFLATLRDGTGDVSSTNRLGIWSDRSGSVDLVARAGSQAPGTPTGTNFSYFDFLSFNNQGEVAFVSLLEGSGVNSSNWTGVWSEGNGSQELVARSGDQAPGAPPGALFNIDHLGGDTWLAFNDLGQVAFTSNLMGTTGAQNRGLWTGTAENLELVALAGTLAPGAGGETFDRMDGIALNNAGQVVFTSQLEDGRFGIWAQDRSGILQLIAVDGQGLEVAPGDVRTIAGVGSLGNHGNNDGRAISFNDRGQLVFRAEFTDGSWGYFVSNVVAVPEPQSFLLLTIAVAGAFIRRRV
jgi:hypothetical protein